MDLSKLNHNHATSIMELEIDEYEKIIVQITNENGKKRNKNILNMEYFPYVEITGGFHSKTRVAGNIDDTDKENFRLVQDKAYCISELGTIQKEEKKIEASELESSISKRTETTISPCFHAIEETFE